MVADLELARAALPPEEAALVVAEDVAVRFEEVLLGHDAEGAVVAAVDELDGALAEAEVPRAHFVLGHGGVAVGAAVFLQVLQVEFEVREGLRDRVVGGAVGEFGVVVVDEELFEAVEGVVEVLHVLFQVAGGEAVRVVDDAS